MFFLNTLPNSFILGEKDDNGNIIKQLGFPKGGLTYLIENNNIKFYLTPDYMYRNVVFSADAPFLINGIPVSVDNLPSALKNIFKVEQEAVDVDTEFDDQSFNPIANAPVAIRFNDVDSTIDSLSGEVQTKADIEDIPTNVSELVNDAGYITEESLSEDYATKVWVQEQGYVTQNDIDAAVSGKADTSAVTASLAALDEKKLDASAYTPTDLSNYYTKDETSGATEIATALDGKADIEDIPTNVSELVNDEGYVTQNDIDAAVSGKVNTTDFNTYSANTDNRLSEDEEVTSAALNALNAVSGDVNTLSGQVATISGDIQTLSGSVESLHGAVSDVVGDVSTLSGKVNTDETILTGHTANTDIHVTASDKQNWNNKSDFSGDYNDLTNKPTIPVVPTNVSDFVNDAGYATSGYVDSSVSGKVNTTDFNTYSASTDARLAEDEEVTAAALNALNDALDGKADLEDIPTNVSELVNDAGYATSGYVNTAIATKQDTLVSGTNIKTINNESLLGSGNIDIQGGGSYTAGDGIDITNDVISVTGKMDTSTFSTYSASTDARLSEDEEVTAAGLNVLNDKFGGMKLVQISESDYEALVTKDPSVLYIIPETN